MKQSAAGGVAILVENRLRELANASWGFQELPVKVLERYSKDIDLSRRDWMGDRDTCTCIGYHRTSMWVSLYPGE